MMQQTIGKNIHNKMERRAFCFTQTKQSFKAYFSIDYGQRKGSFTFVLTLNVNVRFLLEQNRPERIKETQHAQVSF